MAAPWIARKLRQLPGAHMDPPCHAQDHARVAELKQLHTTRAARARRNASTRRAKPRAPFSDKSGRAWINGREVGGTDPRFAHLNNSYD
jgi:hypothetical protein